MPSLKINDPSIDWMSRDSHFFFDTRRLRAGEWKNLKPPFFPGHIYLFTSSHRKIAVLPKEAFLVSARTVNRHLKCVAEDRWLIALPLTHVAGIAVLARSFCGSFSIVKMPGAWNPKVFRNVLKTEKITLSALVPAQVYDVVGSGLSAPDSLRAVLVGGGALSPSLYRKARGLGWPLLPSYGLTELCSQVAVAGLSSVKNPISAVADSPSLLEGKRSAKGESVSLTAPAYPMAGHQRRGGGDDTSHTCLKKKPLNPGELRPADSVPAGGGDISHTCLKKTPLNPGELKPAGFASAGGDDTSHIRLKKTPLNPGELRPADSAPAGGGDISHTCLKKTPLNPGELRPADSAPAGGKDPSFPDLGILPHIQLKVEKGTFHVKSKALLKGYFDPEENRFWDPKLSGGWFDTGDLGELSGKNLRVKGRRERQIKILGELTDLTELSRQLKSVVSSLRLGGRFLLVPVPDPRKTWDLQLITTSFDEGDILKAVRGFNKRAAPFQRIKKVYVVSKLPAGEFSGLFKISPEDIRKHIGLPSDPP